MLLFCFFWINCRAVCIFLLNFELKWFFLFFPAPKLFLFLMPNYHICFLPSIHPLSILLIVWGSWGWSQSQLTLGREEGYTLNRSPAYCRTYIQRQKFTFTLTANDCPTNQTPTCMSLDCGRKLVYQEKTHVDAGRTCKLHIDSRNRIQTGTFVLWGNSASHL